MREKMMMGEAYGDTDWIYWMRWTKKETVVLVMEEPELGIASPLNGAGIDRVT